MIVGAHAIIYSQDASADRAFLRDLLRSPTVDAGDGWLILGLPPSEVAVHPAEENGRHELYLMCDDVDGLVRALERKGVACSPVTEEGWGRLTLVGLPGGGKLGIYEPRHPRPVAAVGRRPGRKVARDGRKGRPGPRAGAASRRKRG
ncbi:MAG TPA: hypothetical protein VMK42_06610 [Anaeromyxobacteraceae bacterium]|nr:hypothetical protein [Anaeromyxobacteraceae bacterium]